MDFLWIFLFLMCKTLAQGDNDDTSEFSLIDRINLIEDRLRNMSTSVSMKMMLNL
jgi:hypothetical protein